MADDPGIGRAGCDAAVVQGKVRHVVLLRRCGWIAGFALRRRCCEAVRGLGRRVRGSCTDQRRAAKERTRKRLAGILDRCRLARRYLFLRKGESGNVVAGSERIGCIGENERVRSDDLPENGNSARGRFVVEVRGVERCGSGGSAVFDVELTDVVVDGARAGLDIGDIIAGET